MTWSAERFRAAQLRPPWSSAKGKVRIGYHRSCRLRTNKIGPTILHIPVNVCIYGTPPLDCKCKGCAQREHSTVLSVMQECNGQVRAKIFFSPKWNSDSPAYCVRVFGINCFALIDFQLQFASVVCLGCPSHVFITNELGNCTLAPKYLSP